MSAPLGLAAALTLIASPAIAGDRQLTTVWMIEEAPVSPEEREVVREDFVIRQRLMPVGVAQLTAVDLPSGIDASLSAAQLVEIRTPNALVFCDPEIRSQKPIGHAQSCFVDADRDGRFEAMFLTSSVTKGLLTIQGNRPKNPKAITPIPYKRLLPEDFKAEYFVGVQYRGNANPAHNHVFEINFGTQGKMGALSDRFIIKRSEIPGSRTPFGGQFTILSENQTGIKIRVDRPFPSQPFGIVQTTTYRIY